MIKSSINSAAGLALSLPSLVKRMPTVRWRSVILTGTLLCSLQACVPVIIGGAVVGGLAATDRRSLGSQTDDKTLLLRVSSRVAEVSGADSHVNTTVYSGTVLLSGEVTTDAYREAAGKRAREIDGVTRVQNDLGVGPASSFSSRSNDTYLTSKVKASLIDAKDVLSRSVKVTTERSTVFLMGMVTEQEGNRIADIAAGVSGVKRVVKVFNYITEADLQKLSTSAQTNPQQTAGASTGDRATGE